MNPPVVVVPDGPDDPMLPLADVVVATARADWFTRLPGLALVLVPGREGYTIHRRDGMRVLRAGPVGDPTAAAGAAYAAWLADQGAVSRSS
ncbi:hypothetical protein AB0K00_44785 [Dactylosporangium sp. NPDC049525]|uniref:hypothetical protein n=1 Tax=Dactylosporangium sp. NPDC049525 TaxID=3154730 RepID=UPI00341F11DB